MTNLMFTLWMLLFPVASAVSTYLQESNPRRQYAAESRGLAVFLELVTWLGVGYLLYGT
jgi:hypothetical protein